MNLKRAIKQVGFLILLILSVVSAGAQSGRLTAALRYAAPEGTKSVAVAGTFNHWNKSADLMIHDEGSRIWRLRLSLEPGVYQYKFVIDDKTWVNDPTTPTQDDENGNVNNLLAVYPAGYSLLPGRLGDNRITQSAVVHEPSMHYVRRLDRTHLVLTLRTRHDDVSGCDVWIDPPPTRRCIARTDPATHRTAYFLQAFQHLFQLHRANSDPLYDYWQATVEVTPGETLHYLFRLNDGPTWMRYGRRGLKQDVDLTGSTRDTVTPVEAFTLKVDDFPPFETPDWARDAVFYQIFPDRFADGDPSNDGPDALPFGAKPDASHRQGGDLAGVMQHLDYLKRLGINALYFNPIFAARSNHGYDTIDYRRVDPHFGVNRQLTALDARVHALGWHVILDGVFNHTGVDFAAFKSLREQADQSPYRNWYFVNHFPIEVKARQTSYVGWFGSPWLPKLNVDNPETRRYLLDVAVRWIKEAHIDGWRLDAADEVDPAYWKTFRRVVHSADPNAYIVGEIWGNAHDWLQGDQFDSVMNYRWRGAVLDFFAQDKIEPSQFDHALERIRADYPPAATAVMFNILDSHDTERIRNTCNGKWDHERQAVLFQMSYPGTPSIYYGDEIGMGGGKDPDDRRAMLWDRSRWDKATLEFYQRVLAAHKAHPSLRRGGYRTVIADDATGLFGFVRSYGKESALVLFNRSDRPQHASLPIKTLGPSGFRDWLGLDAKVKIEGDRLIVDLPARGIALLGT